VIVAHAPPCTCNARGEVQRDARTSHIDRVAHDQAGAVFMSERHVMLLNRGRVSHGRARLHRQAVRRRMRHASRHDPGVHRTQRAKVACAQRPPHARGDRGDAKNVSTSLGAQETGACHSLPRRRVPRRPSRLRASASALIFRQRSLAKRSIVVVRDRIGPIPMIAVDEGVKLALDLLRLRRERLG
jgi:hypothetical protein